MHGRRLLSLAQTKKPGWLAYDQQLCYNASIVDSLSERDRRMQTHIRKRIGCRSALALLLALAGNGAVAQTPAGMPPGDDPNVASFAKFSDTKVNIDAENKRLIEVLPDLMKSAGADFTIDADVKNARISSHLTNIRLQTALDTLMRVSDIPVQYTFEKGLYHFAKKRETAPEPPRIPPPADLLPEEPLLPGPPTVQQDEVDVHNVQTYDLLRVLNGIFNVPIQIIPTDGSGPQGTPNGYGDTHGDFTGFTNSHGFGLNGNGITTSGGSTTLGLSNGNSSGSQTHNIPGSLTLFGHTIHFR